jgi:hypothetical protein
MTDVASTAWVGALVEASQGRSGCGSGGGGVVAIAVGKTKRAVFSIEDGRVGEPADGEPGVTVPVTAKQLAAIVDGTESLAQAFMRGDVKPEGSTGPLLALIELFEDPEFRTRLAALL